MIDVAVAALLFALLVHRAFAHERAKTVQNPWLLRLRWAQRRCPCERCAMARTDAYLAGPVI